MADNTEETARHADDALEQIAAMADAPPTASGGDGQAANVASAADQHDAEPEDGVEDDDGPAPLRTMGYDVEAINEQYAMVKWGGRTVVVEEQADGPIEDRVRVLSVEAFNHWFANRFTEMRGADGKRRMVPWGKAWLTDRQRRQYKGIEFFPNPDGVGSDEGYLNLWRGFALEATEQGDWSIFRDHLLTNVCNEDEALFNWVFAWFAHIVQRPRERLGTALVLRGPMGSGKTKVGEVIGSLIAAHYFQVDDPRYITGNFNAHMAACLLLQADEAVFAGDPHAAGRLKGLITSEVQMIEAKGVDAIRIRNFVRIMMTSNEHWVIPAGMDERRFCVLDVHHRCAQNHQYFGEMQEQLDAGGRARLLYDLQRFDLSKVNLRQIPRTGALLEQKVRSLDALGAWWLARLTEGAPARGMSGWPVHAGKEALYLDYIRSADEIGARRKHDRATFGIRLRKLVPGIVDTRPRVEVEPGVVKKLYSYALPSLADCREAFEEQLGQSYGWPADVASESERQSAEALEADPL